MNNHQNEFQQPVGEPMPNWQAPKHPPKAPLAGTYCTVEPINPEKHGRSLHDANMQAENGRFWTYLPYGPFADYKSYAQWLHTCLGNDPQFYAVVEAQSSRALGIMSYTRITPAHGVIEVGHINFAPPLQQTPAATEAIYLMIKHAFELGYRRVEWKCDDHNEPSKRAARRLGFKPEGIFRQAIVYKGRNRDTAWFAIIDKDWPLLQQAFEAWLAPDNFDENGRQRQRLAGFR